MLNQCKQYDVGILGWWYGKNYGSVMTYYALNRAVSRLGHNVLMVHEALGYNGYRVTWPDDIFSMQFAKRVGYNHTRQVHFSELGMLNSQVDTFLVGSDQLWNPHIGRANDDLFLDFASQENRRIAFGTSFGNRDTKKFKPDFIAKHSKNLQKFDAISVREDYAVDIARSVFGVNALQVVDPVFLLSARDYEELAQSATIKPQGDYLAVFFLDPDPDKKNVALAIAEKLGLNKIVVIPNPDKGLDAANDIFAGDGIEILEESSPENWLRAYKNSKYIVTDSFHGSAFAAIFEKPFSSIYNTKRGADRFMNLMRLLGFGEKRRVRENATREDIFSNENVSLQLDYAETRKLLQAEQKKSFDWLKAALKETSKSEDDIRTKGLLSGMARLFGSDKKPTPNGQGSLNRTATARDLTGKTLTHAAANEDRVGDFQQAPKDKKLPVRDALISNYFAFYREGMSGEVIRQNVRFMPDGSLKNVSHANEAFWTLDGNKLTILNKQKKPTTVIENLHSEYAGNDMKLVGSFLSNPKIKHVFEAEATAVRRANEDSDFARVKLLLAKLRDYGVKDVVLSPGGRDVVLGRALENNQQHFNIHYVLDERSAGYYALGIANKTQKVTAVVVTSGTAASNLAPAMAEAYYMNLPLLAITADRYPEYHGIGEDQTIEQANMFEPMVRKSVNLTVAKGGLNDLFTNRLISDAVLNAKHGPTHINMSFNNLPTMAPIRAAYELPRVRHVRRITALDGENAWKEYADALLKSQKILLLYRQNYKPTPRQLENINKFAQRYNVVIVADWLSNIYGPQVVHPFNALKAMSQSDFNKTLLPEIMISVGTKNVMNHPINFKLRGASSFRHWDVEPHGELKDLYFKLTSVLHVDQDWFFSKFAELGEGHKNNEQYLASWKAADESARPHTRKEYGNELIVQQLLEKMPEKSLFHIGVGSAFMLTHAVNTVPDKEFEVFLNMGTNGIDGSASAFMGQVTVDNSDRLKFLLIGDVSFFYDMNSVWNKALNGNTRILLVNNGGSSLLKHYGSKGSYAPHSAIAEGWVKSVGFTYLSASNKKEFESNLKRFVSKEDSPLFFEVFL